jgi:hypothetical protein
VTSSYIRETPLTFYCSHPSLNKDLSRQLNEMRIENESLFSQNASQQKRIHDLSTKLLPPGHRTGMNPARPPSVQAGLRRSGFQSAYDLHKSRDDNGDSTFGGDGGPPAKRTREMMERPREMMGPNG